MQIAVLGVSGRMGRALLTAIDEAPGAKLGGATASANSRWLGQDSEATDGAVRNANGSHADPRQRRCATRRSPSISHCLEATAANLAACVAARCPVVIGTTGHSEAGASADRGRRPSHSRRDGAEHEPRA